MYAREYFSELVKVACITPYNQLVIGKLKAFDYDLFQGQNKLMPSVFEKVKGYLINGDVTGVYESIKNNKSAILEVLYDVKLDVDNNVFPKIKTLHRLNQQYLELMLFGQYVAEVFRELK